MKYSAGFPSRWQEDFEAVKKHSRDSTLAIPGSDEILPARTPLSVMRRLRDLVELVGIQSLILLVIWTSGRLQLVLSAVATVTIATLIVRPSSGWRTLGLCTRNLGRSSWAVGAALAAALVLLVAAERLHTLCLPLSPEQFLSHYGGYALWAALQQLILQGLFLSRAMRLFSNATAAAALSAGMFAIAHLPNPILVAVTLICGLASCLFFLRYRNLWPLVLAHAILGAAIAVAVPGTLDHNMRVGIAYWSWVDRPVVSESLPLP